jgi:hypothetical protein
VKWLGWAAPLTAAAAILASPGVARADDETGALVARPRQRESAQHWAMEFRGALYQPQIDSEPGVTGNPYNTVFGDMQRLELAFELDWQALRIPYVGTLGPGVSVGYTSMGDKAARADGKGKSAEDTSLDIFPFYGVVVLRADVLQREIGVPVVPYVKGGIGFAFWRASNTAGTSVGNGTLGKGHTWGTHMAGGLALQLNAFDPHAARQLDESMGINNTYLFGEYMISDLTGLGQTHPLYVGTHSFAFGLAFEF